MAGEIEAWVNDNDPAPAANEVPADSDLNRWYTGQQDAAQLGYAVDQAGDPDTAARILRLQGRTGLPGELIARNLDDVERQAAAADFDPEKYRRESPIVATWLAEHPDHAAVARDDLHNLGYLERQLRHLGSQFEAGRLTVELKDIGEAAILGRITPAQRKRQAEIQASLRQQPDYGISGFFEGIPGAVANQLPIFAQTLLGKVKGAAVGGVVGGTAGAVTGGGAALIAGQAGPQIAAPEEAVTVPAAAAAGAVTGARAGAIAGWRYGAAIEAGRMEASLAYLDFEELKDENGVPLGRDVALAAAGVVGVVNGSLEALGFESIAKTVPGLRALTRDGMKHMLANPTVRRALLNYAKNIGTAMATEGATEFLQSLTKNAVGELATMVQDGSIGTAAPEEILGRVFSEGHLAEALAEGRAGAQAGGGMATVFGGASAIADVRKVKQAQRNADLFTAIGQTVADTKLRERLPEKLQEVVARLTQDGPIENVYLSRESWDTYWQTAGVDPRAVAAEVLGDTRAYDEAVQTGIDLAIPTPVYATKLAATEHHAALVPELRTGPAEMNAREASEWMAQQDALAPDAEADTDSAGAVREDVLGQLLGAGYQRDVAEAYAGLYESTFRTLAARTGTDAAALYGRYGLKIDRELPEVLTKVGRAEGGIDALLDRLRAGDIPTETAVFGPSLLEFLRPLGLQDQGGELSARDADKARKPFQRRLVREDGITLDDAAEKAVEAGYIEERDPDLLLAAIDNELRGTPVYAQGRANPQLQEVRATLTELEQYLGQLGVDLAQTDNATVRRLLAPPAEAETAPVPVEPALADLAATGKLGVDGTTLYQTHLIKGAQHQAPVRDVQRAAHRRVAEREAAQSAGEPRADQVIDDRARGPGDTPGLEVQELSLDEAFAAGLTADPDTNRDIAAQLWRQYGVQSTYFRRWFGQSKMVNKAGAPVVFHHGTRFTPELYDPARAGQASGFAASGLGFFVTADKTLAQAHGDRTLAGYVKLERPYVLKADQMPDFDSVEQARAFSDALRDRGHDGIYVPETRTAIVFDSAQYKLTDNRGTFDPTDARFLYQSETPVFDPDATVEAAEIPGGLFDAGPDLLWTTARDWYAQHLQGAAFEAPDHTAVRFSKLGKGKALSTGRLDALRMSVVKALPRLVESAPVYQTTPDRGGKAGVHYAYAAGAVTHAGTVYPVKLVYRVGQEGSRQFYDFTGYEIEDPGAIVRGRTPGGELGTQGPPGSTLSVGDLVEAFNGPVFFQSAPIPPEAEIAALRAKVAALEQELRTSEKTGLRNRRAFTEDEALGWATVAAFDMDGLKRLNTAVGHGGADQVLRALGGLLLKAEADGGEVRIYHLQGDEFALRMQDAAQATAFLADLQARLDQVDVEIDTLDADGNAVQYVYQGIGISYGIGGDYDQADARAEHQKQQRLASGQREDARGDEARPPRRLRPAAPGPGRGRAPGQPQGLSLGQGTPGDIKKGYIRIGGGRKLSIRLLEKADLSTFLHETGHFYLELLGDIAQDPNAPTEIRDDYQSVLDWLGVRSRDEITVAHHEQWARGFEAYLMEGKTPSTTLNAVFARFRAWLIAVYRTFARLNVTLTDDVRGVMDRLIATDEEIAAARTGLAAHPLFTDATQAGMTPEEFAAYQRAVAAARAAAESELLQKLMVERRRESEKWWKEARAQVREEVEAEVNEQKAYIAQAVLARGTLPDGSALPPGVKPIKLARQAIVDAHGADLLKRLPKPYVYAKAGGVHPDQAADLFGYGSGEELLMALVNLRPRKVLIEAETDARMRERYGDMRLDGSIADEAMQAVHNQGRGELLLTELRKLAGRTNRRIVPLEVLRAQAERTIAQRRARDIRPVIYQRAETKAARAAVAALAKGDFEAAFMQKQRELLNHELYRAAASARAAIDDTVDYMAKFGKRSTRERLGKAGHDYLDQIDAILDRFDFRKGVSLKAVDRRTALVAWVNEQNETGFTVNLPARLLNEAYRRHYKDTTFEELLGIRDAVKTIEHLAAVKNKLLANKRAAELEQARTEIVASIEAHHDTRPQPIDFAPGLRKRVAEKGRGFLAAHTKLEFLFEWLDGYKNQGPVWQHLFKPFVDAEATENKTMREVVANVGRIFGAYPRKERATWFFRKTHIPEIGGAMTKANMLAVALNWGNQYNRDALMRGYGWSEAQVQAILQQLDKRDWDTVQAVWDYIDTFWPAIEQQERELNGVAPAKVEAAAVTTPHGTYRGGYYPVVFDSKLSWRQAVLEEKANVKDLFGGHWARAMTRHGHTTERTDTGGKPIKLELSGLTEHMTNVVHDLAFRPALIDVGRLVNDKAVREAIERSVGREYYRQLNPWLVSMASDRRDYANPVEGLLGRARMSATVVNMGWKLTTAITQVLGFTVSLKELGARYTAAGIADVYTKPWKLAETWEFVASRSDLMANRRSSYDRDVRDALKRLNVAGAKPGVLSAVDAYTVGLRDSWFALIGYMDMAVSLPTWLGAYRKALDGKVDNVAAGDEAAAIDYADSMVRQTQGSGAAKDLALVQRGAESFRIFTMFYSYFSVLFNQFGKTFRQFRADRNAPKLLASLALLWFGPAVMQELMLGRGPDDDADEEEWIKWLLGKELLYPFQSLVFVRDVANGMDEYGYEPSAAFDMYESIAKTGKLAVKAATGEKEDIERTDVKGLTMTAGYALGLPTRQIWLTGEYFYDWLTGEVEPEHPGEALWRGLVTGKPKE